MDIIVPVSGGKDSTATLLLALEFYNTNEIRAVHNYTGWDHPVTYEYLDYLQKETGVKIESTKFVECSTLPELIKRQGKFPFRLGRFCTSELKTTAMMRWFWNEGYYHSKKAECWFGMRTSESITRAKKYANMGSEELYRYKMVFPRTPEKLSKNVKIRLPVVDWSREQVFSYIEECGLKYNPLYDEPGNDRVGCYPCMLAPKKAQELILSTKVGQERLSIIKQLEKDIGSKYEMYDTDQGGCEVCNI